jgi:hypothetical protein
MFYDFFFWPNYWAMLLFFSALVGAYAQHKKRDSIKWFIISIIISPLIAFIILAFLKPLDDYELSLASRIKNVFVLNETDKQEYERALEEYQKQKKV